ncbi:MAG: TonB-dependent receptor [Chitinophagaceae bacterium]
MKFLYSFVLLFLTNISFAQKDAASQNSFSITVKIIDAYSKDPIEYATASIRDDSSKKIINGGISDKKGTINLAGVKPGAYTFTVQFIGFRDSSQQISVTDNLLLPDIALVKKAAALQNVTVTSSRPVIENKLDKMVYNIDRDITSQGGIATDALKKIPGVTVDINGNVELLGNPSVRFLIDGKPSAIFGNSVADALQSIPNSQIQSIEVITSPSAKYDASGTGGIINIILKKSKIEGFNGNINLAAGSRLDNASLNTSYKRGNIGLNAYFSGNAQLRSSTPGGFDRITSDGTKRLLQDGITDVSRNGYKGGMSMDWSLSKSQSLAASFGFDHFGFNNSGTIYQRAVAYGTGGSELSNIATKRNADNKVSVTDFENSLSYKKNFKKEGQTLELAYSGSFGKNTTAYNQQQYYTGSTTAFAGANSINPGKENEVTIELNYTHPLKNEALIETGLRTTFQSIISNADVLALNAATGNYAKDQQQSYASDYRRKVYAAYISGNFSLFGALDVKAGARYEYTVSKADYSTAHNVAIPDYSNLAPSLIIAHNFGGKQTLKLAYSYRIERPDFRDLNPFMNLSDPHNITTGNPNLQPEIGHKFELGYNKSFASGAYIYLVAYRQRNSPDIKPYITYYATYKIGDSTYNDVTLTTRETIAAETTTGVSISGSIPVSKKISFRPNFQIFNRHLNNPNAVPAITDAFGLRLNLNTSFQVSKTFAAEVFGNYNKGMRWQGKQADVYSYTFAIRKQFTNNKASFGFIAVNPFNKYINQKSLQFTKDFTSNIYRNTPYRSFGLTFSYRFGSLKVTKTKEPESFDYAPPAER